MAQSDHYPMTTAPRNGRTLYRYNIVEKQVADPQTGRTRTVYEYDEVEIDGSVTRAKVLAAIREAEREVDTRSVADAMTAYVAAKGRLKNSKVKTLSVSELGKAVADILDILGIEYAP